MIPDIGVLVAAYVFTRMVVLLAAPVEADGWRSYVQLAARVCAFLTIVVAVVVGIDLLLRGTTGVSLPELAR